MFMFVRTCMCVVGHGQRFVLLPVCREKRALWGVRGEVAEVSGVGVARAGAGSGIGAVGVMCYCEETGARSC